MNFLSFIPCLTESLDRCVPAVFIVRAPASTFVCICANSALPWHSEIMDCAGANESHLVIACARPRPWTFFS